ncbi:MAG: hypothetical protein J5879_07080 [Clostridia bacterium]|nr:hypothetical protein [Clostridia bacterium]
MIVRIDCSDNYVAYIISSSGKDAVILYDISENKRSEIYTAMKIDTTFLTCTGKYVFIGLTYGSIVETKKVLKYDIENDVLSTVFSVDVNDGCAFYAYDEYSGEYMYKYDGDFYLTSNGEYNHMTKINLPEKNKYEYWPDFGYFSRAYPNVLYDHTIDSIVPIPTDKPFYSVKSNGRYCHITRPEDDVMTRNKEYESKSGEKGEYFTCEIYLQNSDGEYSAYELSSDYIGYPLAVYENKILMGVILEYRGSNSVVDVYDRYVWIDLDNGNAVSFKIDNNRWRGPVSEKIDIKLSEIAK